MKTEWKARLISGYSGGVVDETRATVQIDTKGMTQQQATAITNAAPDLLEALKMAIKALQDNNIDEAMAGEFEILTDAVEKAEGTQS